MGAGRDPIPSGGDASISSDSLGFWGLSFLQAAGSEIDSQLGIPVFSPVNLVVNALTSLFQGLFGGGSSGPPAWEVWRLNHQGGNLQEWAKINGVDRNIAPSWQPAGGIQLIKDATKKAKRPLKKSPEYHKALPRSPGNLNFFDYCHIGGLTITGVLCAGTSIGCGASIPFEPEDAPVNAPACGMAVVTCAGFADEAACCYHPRPACANPDADWTRAK